MTEDFVAELAVQGTRYHNLHPFHQRMDAGALTREELQRWVRTGSTTRSASR